MRFFRFASLLAASAFFGTSVQATDLSVLQQNYVDQGYGLFMHYSMGTYTGEEWASSGLNVDTFHPTAAINTNQWAQVALDAGMKYGVLTAKHHDGFALWDSGQSTYDFAGTTWYNTADDPNYQRDIVSDYVNSFRNAGLGVGLYYSFWDKQNGIGPTSYTTPKNSADATAYVKAEINELLTNYGHIDVLWSDGWGWNNTSNGAPYSLVDYTEIYNYIKTISPDTLLLNNVNEGNLNHTDVVGYEAQYSGQLPPAGNTAPSEAVITLRSDNHWFWTGPTNSYKPAGSIAGQIITLNARSTTYLLDVPPDQSGAIPQSAINRLHEIKAYLDAYRPENLALGKIATESSNWGNANPASKAVDGDPTNFAHTATDDTSPWWMVDLGELTEVGEIILYNRPGYAGRLRDITIEIMGEDGQTVLYTSELLNPGNALGGGIDDYTNGPDLLGLLLDENVPGQFIRISRTAETSGAGTLDDLRTLTLTEVGVYAVPEPSAGTLLVLTVAGLLVCRHRGQPDPNH